MRSVKKYIFWPFYSNLRRITEALPFTIKGITLLAICLWSFTAIGLPKEDLVISILCTSIIALILILSIFTLAIGMKIRSKISFALGFSESTTFAQAKNWLSIIAENSSIPAFFNLKVTCQFNPKAIETSELILSGEAFEARHCAINANFPHRGFWQLNGFIIEFSDALGLCQKVWRQHQKKTIRVMPLPVEIQTLPLIASSAKPGDEISLPRERSGDPFDIKQYEPSDGVRRILWKTYARSRQLFVRRPELAVIPEGEVAVYLVAGRDDDHVAAACMHQIKSLFNNDLLVVFGTDLSSEAVIENSFEKIEDLMLKAALDPISGTGKGIGKFISQLTDKGYNLGQINVFASDGSEIFEELAVETSTIRASAIKVNLILVENPNKPRKNFSNKNLGDFEINYVRPIMYANL